MSQEVAIVSGGGGGIGSVLCRRLAELGYSVVIADSSSGDAEAVLKTLVGPSKHQVVIGDLAAEATNQEVVRTATALGELTVVVNAVGISPKDAGNKIPFFDITPELWDLVMAVNVKAPFLLTRACYNEMPRDGRSSIINVLSITARMGTGGLATDSFPPFLPSTAVYAASKAALQNITASISRELASFKIRVNGVSPGLVSTAMTGEVTDKGGMASQIPMNRFGRPEEIADAIEFLISQKASYITGASIEINGGWQTC